MEAADSRTRQGGCAFPHLLTGQSQKVLSLASLQGRHSPQKLVQRETRRHVVDQHLHWNPGSSEAGCSRKPVGVDPHDSLQPAKENSGVIHLRYSKTAPRPPGAPSVRKTGCFSVLAAPRGAFGEDRDPQAVPAFLNDSKSRPIPHRCPVRNSVAFWRVHAEPRRRID